VNSIPGMARPIPAGALKEVGCGLCGSLSQRLHFKDGPFSVVHCADCGLTYVTPRLNDAALIDEVYNEGYWSSNSAKHRGYTDYRSDADLYVRTYELRTSIIARHFPRPGRVLDVGCAAGYFLGVMKGKGWQIQGLEPSAAIRPQAIERLGEGVVAAEPLGTAELAAGSFDLVTFWDVIEHIPDPVAALAEARRLLAPGGKILIETQNVKSLAARVLGRKWQHYKHAEHIYHFNRATLADACGKAGLDIIENRARLGGKYVSLGFIQERAGRLHPLLSALFFPLKWVADASLYVNLFDEMIAIAEPQSS